MRFFFGPTPDEVARLFDVMAKARADNWIWNAEEDRLYYIWHKENPHRFTNDGLWKDGAMQEFFDYCRANWTANVPYRRKP